MADNTARAVVKPTVAPQREPAASKKPGAAGPVVAPDANSGLGVLYSTGPALGLAPSLQCKIVVGPPDDPFEQEADRVAERVTAGGPVMRISHLPTNGFARLAQRQPADEEATDAEEVQRQAVEEEEPAQMLAVQRQDDQEEEEPAQMLAVQRQAEEEEENRRRLWLCSARRRRKKESRRRR
jgi:hypothetical protein